MAVGFADCLDEAPVLYFAVHVLRGAGEFVGRILRPRAWVLLAVTAALASMLPGVVAAQDRSHADVRASFTADRTSLTVGDVVQLTLIVTHPPGHAVVFDRLGPEWGPFDVISQTPARVSSGGDGTQSTGQQLHVTLFAPGTFDTPDLPISVRDPEGVVEWVHPAPVRLTVISVLSGTDDQLVDIRPPMDLESTYWRSPAVLAIAAIAMVVALAPVAYMVNRRFIGRKPGPGPVQTLTPWEIAGREMDRVERLDLPRAGRHKEHYALVAAAVRDYVRAVYLTDPSSPDGTDMTTGEIEAALQEASLDRKHSRLILDLLLEADLCRFANYTPPATQAREALHRAREVLEAVRPPAEEEGQSEAET